MPAAYKTAVADFRFDRELTEQERLLLQTLLAGKTSGNVLDSLSNVLLTFRAHTNATGVAVPTGGPPVLY